MNRMMAVLIGLSAVFSASAHAVEGGTPPSAGRQVAGMIEQVDQWDVRLRLDNGKQVRYQFDDRKGLMEGQYIRARVIERGDAQVLTGIESVPAPVRTQQRGTQ